jgi:hypothetical protein
MTLLMCLAIWRFLRGNAPAIRMAAAAEAGETEPTAPVGAAHS